MVSSLGKHLEKARDKVQMLGIADHQETEGSVDGSKKKKIMCKTYSIGSRGQTRRKRKGNSYLRTDSLDDEEFTIKAAQ